MSAAVTLGSAGISGRRARLRGVGGGVVIGAMVAMFALVSQAAAQAEAGAQVEAGAQAEAGLGAQAETGAGAGTEAQQAGDYSEVAHGDPATGIVALTFD